MAKQHQVPTGWLTAYARSYTSETWRVFWQWAQVQAAKLPTRRFASEAEEWLANIRRWPNRHQGFARIPASDLRWMPWLTDGPVVIDDWMVWLARKQCSPQLRRLMARYRGKILVCRHEKAPAEDNP